MVLRGHFSFNRPLTVAQAPPAILKIDTENFVSYVFDETDRTKFATNPELTKPVPAANFGTFIFIADIVAVNSTPTRGMHLCRGLGLKTSPTPMPGHAISDVVGAGGLSETTLVLGALFTNGSSQADGRGVDPMDIFKLAFDTTLVGLLTFLLVSLAIYFLFPAKVKALLFFPAKQKALPRLIDSAPSDKSSNVTPALRCMCPNPTSMNCVLKRKECHYASKMGRSLSSSHA